MIFMTVPNQPSMDTPKSSTSERKDDSNISSRYIKIYWIIYLDRAISTVLGSLFDW